MKSNRVMLRVEEFRAIGKAEIKLDGITVVAGVNGCGKSTLSKILYTAFNLTTDFMTYLKNNMTEEVEISIDVLHQFIRLLTLNIDAHSEVLSSFITYANQNTNQEGIFITKEQFLINLKELLIKYNSDKVDTNMPYRINMFWELCFEKYSHLDTKLGQYLQKIKGSNNWIDMIDFMIFYEKLTKEKYFQSLVNQPMYYFSHEIKSLFHINHLPKQLEVWENEIKIISLKQENMMTPFKIDNVIYIDTPMFFGHTEEEHWKDANEKLKQRPKLNEKPKPIQEIDDLIKRQIFRNGAEVKFDELSESFTFRTSSGVEMDLSDSATGMKTFAVLDRLVKNGSINKKTLLILDEPEAHLHPQWIVELGRLLTLINKHIGAKIFVATHSPDMVQALRYIPNKEGTGDNVNFYLAEFNQENGLFDYKDLNGKVGEIFTSFNKSLDKLEEYGDEA